MMSRMETWAVAAGMLCVAAGGGFPPPELGNWGGLARHPAVVNPAVPATAPGLTLSLRGEWEFVCKGKLGAQLRNQQGQHRHFYRQDWPGSRKIQVPGCWETQGVGEPGASECWDCKEDNSAKAIRHKYMGYGWYRKTVTLPAAWAGKRIWLKIGGVRSQGWFWVNDEQVAHVNDYCGTYKYEITDFVTPGKTVKIVAQISNELPARKGSEYALHKWGGIHRDVELEATDAVFVDDAWMRGDFDARTAEMHVKIAGLDRLGAEERTALKVRCAIDGATAERALVVSNGLAAVEQTLTLPLGDFRPWSPLHPNLYTGRVDLVLGDRVVGTRWERFGLRKLEVRGRELFLNNRPFFVRGYGDNFVNALEGVPPADAAFYRGHFGIARAAGFNFARLHTRCEVPEYFDAADECGMLIQPELPYYTDMPTMSFEFDPPRDVTELWEHFRRHPSFAVYSMGNEGSYGKRLAAWMHRYVKAMDPDRLKINQDSGKEWVNAPGTSDYFGGPPKVWARASRNPARPFVCHEYLNLCVKLDSRLEPRFTGAWLPPVTRKGRAAWLAARGLDLAFGDRLQDAQHALQRTYQKSGLESARVDPYCDGYIYWSIIDCAVDQGTTFTAQGLFTPFWERKPGGFSPQQFFAFNGPVCVLADFRPQARIFTAGESAEIDVLLSNYGEENIPAARAKWRIRAGGRVLVQGVLPTREVPVGPVRKLGTVNLPMPDVPETTAAVFDVSVGGASNCWDVWLFPKRVRCPVSGVAVAADYLPKLDPLYEGLVSVPKDGTAPSGTRLVVAPAGSPLAERALAAGVNTLTLAAMDGKPNVELGWWWMEDQVGMVLERSPLLAKLPHAGVLSPLLFRLVKKGAEKLPVTGVDQKDLVIVGEGGEDCFLYLAQKHHASGAVEYRCRALDLLSGHPEATAILDGVVCAP